MMWLSRLVLSGLLLLCSAGYSAAQSIVVLVNDDPITSYDLAQRQRFLALTTGFSDKMKARLHDPNTQEQFKAYMTKERPSSKEEAQELQKKFVAKLQEDVVASTSGAMRKQAIDQLIEEKLMLQAAKDQKITVSDDDVNQTLTRMAEGGQRKLTLQEFLAQFNTQGINPATLRDRIRAQTAWRQVIRRVYGSLVQSTVSSVETYEKDQAAATVDVKVVSLSIPNKAPQPVIAKRLAEAEQIRKRFTSCDKLDEVLKGVEGAAVKTHKSAKLTDFRGEVRAALEKAQPEQMTPAVISGPLIESHALCAKTQTVATGKTTEKKADTDKTQEEFQLYSKRHLKDLKDHARLDYKNG